MKSKLQSLEIPVDLSPWRNGLCSHPSLVSPLKDHSHAFRFCLCNPCPLHYQLPSGFLSPTHTYKHLIALIRKIKKSLLWSQVHLQPLGHLIFFLEGSCLPVYVFCFYFLIQFPPCPLQTGSRLVCCTGPAQLILHHHLKCFSGTLDAVHLPSFEHCLHWSPRYYTSLTCNFALLSFLVSSGETSGFFQISKYQTLPGLRLPSLPIQLLMSLHSLM